NGFTIGGRPETTATSLERPAELDEVVDFAIGGEHELTGGHRLVAVREIDDRQPSLRNPERSGEMQPEVVGAAVGQHAGHPAERGGIRGAVSYQDASDAAHGISRPCSLCL